MIRIGLAGLIGYESARRLYEIHEDELRERFSGRFIKDFLELSERNVYASELTWTKPPVNENGEGLEGILNHMPYVGTIGSGGLWAALWKAAEYLKSLKIPGPNTGCPVMIPDIYLRQEIIEISELYAEDPYETSSDGALLVIWNEDELGKMPPEAGELIRKCKVMGYITGDKQRVVTDGEMVRFLTPPSRQEKDINDRRSHS